MYDCYRSQLQEVNVLVGLIDVVHLGCDLEHVVVSKNIASFTLAESIRFWWSEPLYEVWRAEHPSQRLAAADDVGSDGRKVVLLGRPFPAGDQRSTARTDLQIVTCKGSFTSCPGEASGEVLLIRSL